MTLLARVLADGNVQTYAFLSVSTLFSSFYHVPLSPPPARPARTSPPLIPKIFSISYSVADPETGAAPGYCCDGLLAFLPLASSGCANGLKGLFMPFL